MKVVIDTSSLLSLVRYYLPFDKEGKLIPFFERSIAEGSIVVLDRIAVECRRQGQGQVIKAMPFLLKSKYITALTDIKTSRKLYNQIDNNFTNRSQTSILPPAEYSLKRDEFVNSADFEIILYAYSIKIIDEVSIVTEETGYSNDGKPFKKIPEICKIIGVPSMNLPTFLFENRSINLTIDVVKTTLF